MKKRINIFKSKIDPYKAQEDYNPQTHCNVHKTKNCLRRGHTYLNSKLMCVDMFRKLTEM